MGVVPIAVLVLAALLALAVALYTLGSRLTAQFLGALAAGAVCYVGVGIRCLASPAKDVFSAFRLAVFMSAISTYCLAS
jgi:hypothetical protein